MTSPRWVPGAEAIETAMESRPDLVITDIRMPNMDGTALLRNIRRALPNLPIIALSGYVDPEDVEEYDFDGFVHKPFQLEELRSAVDTAAARVEV